MADTSIDPKPDAVASSEPELAATETEPATNPVHGETAKEEAAPGAVCVVFPSELLIKIKNLMVFPRFTFKR